MGRFGAIYIAHNPRDGHHVYKVGLTERDVAFRMAELTTSTSNLGQYSARAYFIVADIEAAERAAHSRLAAYRVQENREFFELEFKRLLPLVREAVEPFLARDYVPSRDSEDGTSEAPLPLPERVRSRRQQLATAAASQQAAENRKKAELAQKVDSWYLDLPRKIETVRGEFANAKTVRWLEPHDPYPNPRCRPVARVLLIAESGSEPILLKFMGLVKKEEPPRPGSTRRASGLSDGTLWEEWVEPDDGRVAELTMVIYGEGFLHEGKILVKVESVSYDDYRCSWKSYTAGEALCSDADEAIDRFVDIMAEYVASPMTEGRRLAPRNGLSSRQGRERGPRAFEGHYRTSLFKDTGSK